MINNAELNKKVAALATKAKLKAEQDKILKLQALDLFDFKGKNHFEDGGTQICLIFQPV